MTTPTSPMELRHQKIMRRLRIAKVIIRVLPFVLFAALVYIMIINGGRYA